jgi:DNA-binding SARP family transcriptional activator
MVFSISDVYAKQKTNFEFDDQICIMELLRDFMEQRLSNPLLEIFTFGGLQLRCGGEPIKGLGSRKAEALLVYLAAAGTPQQREVLADFFWEERPQSQAMANLRTVLSSLRKQLGSYLSISRYTVALKPDSNYWFDANELKDSLYTADDPRGISSPKIASQVERNLGLYQGDFLEGFYIRECSSFENWLVRERELIRELVIVNLSELVDFNIENRDYQSGISSLKNLLEMNPLLESAHRQLMYLLVYEGQREAALIQFETCKQILKNELDVEPSAETIAFFEVIRSGDPVDASIAATLPELTPFFEQVASEGPVFVGREDQLARMEVHLAQALKGEGRTVLVSGEAGSGKTALVSEFARRALEKHPNLLVASGRCNAFSGQGDAYLPLHQVMETLCCVKNPEWPGAAERLWEAFPKTITTVVTRGPDLIDRLINPVKVMSRAIAVEAKQKNWLDPLKKLIQAERKDLKVRDAQFIIEMYNSVLAALSRHYPLLIILDDLQWVDNASSNILFDLIRKMSGSRILLLGMYRPSEVFSKVDRSNPFEPLIYEVKTHFGDTHIDLDSVPDSEAKAFVDAFLDSEQNQLDASFRENLFAQTGGNPLFTTELLRTMQDHGEIIQQRNEGWVANSDLNWENLPEKVEGVIEARLARLDDWSREILEVASAVGEEFDNQIIAQVLDRDQREVHRTLVKKLGGQHRLVLEMEEKQNANDADSLFRFSHNLFQVYLYSELGAQQQRLTHKAIADALENSDPDNLQALAYHYSKAEDLEKAIDYLIKVADKARHQYATREAVDHYRRALAFIEKTGDQELAERTWMKLALTYQNNFEFKAADQAYTKAFSLRTKLNERIREQSHPPAPHPLRFVSEEPHTIDPTFCGDYISGRIGEQLFSGLVALSPRGNVFPDVARSWDVLDGGRRFVFHLRDNVFWSDGIPVTARDFEFAVKRALHPKTASPIATFCYEIKNARLFHTGKLSDPDLIGVNTRDDYSLEFELENPTAHFLQKMGTVASWPVPRHAVEKYGEEWINTENFVSNGAFKLDSWVRGESLVLKKNPRYHGLFEGNLQYVKVTLTHQVENILQAYLDGDFDILLATALTQDQHVYARQYLSDEYISVPQLGITYISFDTRSRPFNDPRVRRALALATDLDALIRKVFRGCASPANGGLIPPGIPGHAPNIALPYDPYQARSGWFSRRKRLPVVGGYLFFRSHPRVPW